MATKNILDQLTPKQRVFVAIALLIVAGAASLFRGCKDQQQPAPGGNTQTLANRNVRFGLPGDAKHDPAHPNAYLIERPQYVLSYNDSLKIPNWVCWNLNKNDIGNTPRGGFTEDPDLPKGFRRVTTSMYNGSGFDRGHLCPSKDRSDTKENNDPLFYMTNIMPQAPKCNQGAWEQFESYCRTLTNNGSELYIACGPHGQGGTGTNGDRQTIGTNVQIQVPAAVWKVVLVLPNSTAAPTSDTRGIAVWMPNNQDVSEAWKPYIVSIATVEARTGLKFFPLVPDDVATPIKNRVDPGR